MGTAELWRDVMLTQAFVVALAIALGATFAYGTYRLVEAVVAPGEAR